jgi:uncharacterized protein YbjT (DUF2867 family)
MQSAGNNKRLVIVGATGMVGGYALRYALDNPAVGIVTAIGRRKLGFSHHKLREILHQDFADCSALGGALSDQDAAAFCLGTYTGAVPDVELRKVTVDYTVAFAQALCAASPAAALSFLSGSGADATKPAGFRAVQGRGRERSTRSGSPSGLHFPAGLHLSCGAAKRAKFRLQPVAHDLPRVSAGVSQPGDPGGRSGPRHG